MLFRSNSNPSVHKIGEMTPCNRSTTDCEPRSGMLNSFPCLDLHVLKQKSGPEPTSSGSTLPCTPPAKQGALTSQKRSACGECSRDRSRSTRPDGFPIDLDDSQYFKRRSGQKYFVCCIEGVDLH